LAVVAVVCYVKYVAAEPPPSFRETAVTQGELVATIGATGTIEPEEVVNVGAQVVGRIREFGRDPTDPTKPIDYCSAVQEGTVLAYIDDAVYRSQVDGAEAALRRAQADLGQIKAKLLQATQERNRAEQLRQANARLRKTDDSLRVISDSDYDLAVANHAMAEANVGVAEAAVKQAEAALRQSQTNLDYTIIKSPVKGVIVDRRVNVGQTLVSSLNAPSMFLIAKDLRRMQVWASVNEADIGRITLGLPVRFTVDAFPDDVFEGTVAQVRLNASMTQNVVNYTVVVAFDNSDLKLKPYLTASLRFEIDRRTNVLMVPNMALRWKPRDELLPPELRKAKDADASPEEPAVPQGAGARNKRGQLWVKSGMYVRPIDVEIGLSDGSQTEVTGKEVKAGLSIVIGEARRDSGTADTTNPFTPKFFGNKPDQKSSK
jgi:HlyD family secretion protein